MILQIQHLLQASELSLNVQNVIVFHFMNECKLLMMKNLFTYTSEQSVMKMKFSFFFDYHSDIHCLSKSENLKRYNHFIIH